MKARRGAGPDMNEMKKWTVIHKNCREHYATPRILNRLGLLERMITDVWWPPSCRRIFPFANAIGTRWHGELEDSPVASMTAKWLPYKVLDKLRRRSGWNMLEAEDALFQKLAVAMMRSQLASEPKGICFCHSYMALEPFRAAKKAGWKTVLGQIDPGPAEWAIVDAGSQAYRGMEPAGSRPSQRYWDKWRQETELADLIIANSNWSSGLLIEQGIPAEKIRTIPLLFEPAGPVPGVKSYPNSFTEDRPLRILFLGSLCLRKGVPQLLEAARLLRGSPIQIRFIGPQAISLTSWASELIGSGTIQVDPPAKGKAVEAAYDWADAFILPTLSDGFAITQLEAQARRVPVIASTHCASVVEDLVNGRLLADVSPQSISDCLRDILEHPQRLAAWSEASDVPVDCQMASLMNAYRGLADELSVLSNESHQNAVSSNSLL